MKRYTTIFTMIFGLTIFAFAGQAKATAPENDDFENATPLVLDNGSLSFASNNISANKQAGEPNHAENVGGKSVWFKFTPQATSVFRINITNINFDTMVAVYTGTQLNNLQVIGSNNDCSGSCGGASTVDLRMSAGTTYYIAVDSYNNNPDIGEGTFNLVMLDSGSPFSDNFSSAYNFGTGFEFSIAGTTYNATVEPNEPVAYSNDVNGRSVWYKVKAPFTSSMAVDINTDFASQLGIFTSDQPSPTIQQLTRVAANVGGPSFDPRHYKTTFLAQSGKTYYIKISWYEYFQEPTATGNFQLKYYRNNLKYSTIRDSLAHKTSIALYRPSEGNWYGKQNSFVSYYEVTKWGLNGDVPFAADFDGDGYSELVAVRNENGYKIWYILNNRGGNGNKIQIIQWGLATDKISTGDFDHDGRADLVAIRTTGQNYVWYVRRSSDGALRTFTFGISFDRPVVGDFDGDGLTDIAVIRNTQEGFVWHIMESDDGSYDKYTAFQFGTAPDLPVVEDYDGDGKSDVAVFRPSNGTWYIMQSGNGQVNIFNFGLSGDKPQPGDYNDDGKADPAVFRPSEGTWYIAKPTGIPSQNFYSLQWGTSTDIPVSSLATLQH